MGINYDSLSSKVDTLLENNGQGVVFSYTSGEDIDPATGVVTSAGSTTTVNGHGVATKYRNAEIDGETILASDMRLIVANVQSEPLVGWNVSVNSKSFRVMDVENINPAGTNIVYICQIRK